jgi:hypothetical protein
MRNKRQERAFYRETQPVRQRKEWQCRLTGFDVILTSRWPAKCQSEATESLHHAGTSADLIDSSSGLAGWHKKPSSHVSLSHAGTKATPRHSCSFRKDRAPLNEPAGAFLNAEVACRRPGELGIGNFWVAAGSASLCSFAP